MRLEFSLTFIPYRKFPLSLFFFSTAFYHHYQLQYVMMYSENNVKWNCNYSSHPCKYGRLFETELPVTLFLPCESGLDY